MYRTLARIVLVLKKHLILDQQKLRLTLAPTASKVYWFPTGCDPYVPTFLWLINKMAYFITLTFSEAPGCFALPFRSQTL